jgi:hypothetical protein
MICERTVVGQQVILKSRNSFSDSLSLDLRGNTWSGVVILDAKRASSGRIPEVVRITVQVGTGAKSGVLLTVLTPHTVL